MRYVGLLIEQAGRESHNPRNQVTDTAGISDDSFLEWVNYAQSRLQSVILREVPHCRAFDYRTVDPVVAGTSDYEISPLGKVFFDRFIRRVEFRNTSREEDYYPLDFENERNISLQTCNYPSSYTIRERYVVLSPIPSSAGDLRITYVAELPRLDKRRGKIASINSTGTTYNSFVLEDDDSLDSEALDVAEYVCAVTRFGSNAQQNMVVDSWDGASRTLHLSSVTSAGGAVSVGDYITIGRYTSTHSRLPRSCEKYLISYMTWKALKGDSSTDSAEQNEELVAMEQEIVAGFANASLLDIGGVPVLDWSWFE